MIRSKAIRSAANGECCTWPGCGAIYGVVLAHSNMSIHGKAKGQKAHDIFSAFLCNEHHFVYDKDTALSQKEKEWNFMRAMSATILRSFHLELIEVKP